VKFELLLGFVSVTYFCFFLVAIFVSSHIVQQFGFNTSLENRCFLGL